MKEFEFTKGEWRLDENINCTVIHSNEYSFAEVYYNEGADNEQGDYEKEYYANAKLIAAAPNLLYALIELVEIVDNLPEDKSILTALDNAKKAIDKATK